MDWDVWCVVRAGYATLTEIETTWSLADLWDAQAVITAWAVAEAEARRREPS